MTQDKEAYRNKRKKFFKKGIKNIQHIYVITKLRKQERRAPLLLNLFLQQQHIQFQRKFGLHDKNLYNRPCLTKSIHHNISI